MKKMIISRQKVDIETKAIIKCKVFSLSKRGQFEKKMYILEIDIIQTVLKPQKAEMKMRQKSTHLTQSAQFEQRDQFKTVES